METGATALGSAGLLSERGAAGIGDFGIFVLFGGAGFRSIVNILKIKMFVFLWVGVSGYPVFENWSEIFKICWVFNNRVMAELCNFLES